MAVNETVWLSTTAGNALPDVLVQAYKAKNQAREGTYVPENARPARVFKFTPEEKEAVARTQSDLAHILKGDA